MFLDLDIGLTNKDLTITLDRCPSLDNEVIGKFVYHADKSLELILSCLNIIHQMFTDVASQVEKE